MPETPEQNNLEQNALEQQIRRLNSAALDPAHSAVIEACAGSGKTWLLVSRNPARPSISR